MAKTKENIEYLDPKNDKDYLQDLLLNIKDSYENEEILTFRIIELKEKGFVVKTEGLFAYVSLNHFAWSYPTTEFWKNVSNYLIGNYFRGKVHSISEKPISIIINASIHNFDKPDLKILAEYQGIVLHKAKYGVFVDLGFHFNWRFGSLLGLIHKSTLKNKSDYDNWNVGEEITTVFQGFNEEGKLVLGDNYERAKWINEKMDKLIGTIQETKVVRNEDNRLEFYVLGEHQASVPISKEFYPDSKSAVREYFNKLKNGEIINCEVIRINKRKDGFILKLLKEPQID